MKRWLFPLVAFFAPFSLYCYSLAPTFLWSDSSKLALRVFHREIYTFSHGHHPLHTLLGSLFAMLPLELAVTQHLLSAFFGSLTVLLLFLLFLGFGHSHALSLLGALLVMVSHSFWLYSVITETYTLHTFFLILLLLSVQRYLKAPRKTVFSFIFFCLGLALYNHSSAILLVLPLGILVFMKTPLRRQAVSVAALSFALGVSPVFLLPALRVGILHALAGFFRDTGDHMETYVMPQKVLGEWWKVFLYVGYQFPSLAFFAGFLGWAQFKKRAPAFHWAISAIFVMNTCLALIYFLQRQFALLITSYLIFSIWIVAGFEHRLCKPLREKHRVFKILGGVLMLLLPVMVYHSAPILYKKSGLNLIPIRELPYRDSLSYFFTPNKRNVTGARAYAEEVFARVEEGAVIVGDFNSGMALKYYQEVEGARPDITLLLEIDRIHFTSSQAVKELCELLNRHLDAPLYLADSYEPYYHVSSLENYFKLRRLGPIVQVESPL